MHFWAMNLPVLMDLLPPAGTRTLDLACGEGRLLPRLDQAGHNVVGVEGSVDLALMAAETGLQIVAGDAHQLPFSARTFDLVVASMSLQDLDDLARGIAEVARVLRPGGVICASIVHPMASALGFDTRNAVLESSYFSERRYVTDAARAGLRMSFASVHRPLSAYTDALEENGFALEALREPILPDEVVAQHPAANRFRLVPASLHLRARKV